MEIKRTNNYEIFNFKKENREVDYNKVMRLKSKLLEDGRQIIPIICNKSMEIIDGQHRFAALKELNWAIMYYVDEAVTSKDLISINNTQKNWGMLDFVHYYASLGNETYIKLEKICKKYDQFPLKAILTAITEKYVKMNKVKDGDIYFTDEDIEKGVECLEFLNDIRKNIKIRISNQAIFYFLVVKTYYLEGIERERLYNCIVTKYGTENYGTSLQFAMCLEHWYNYKCRTYRYISNEIMPRR